MELKKIQDNLSFITTIYNEEEDMAIFLKSLMDQSMLPAEIVIVDGGSSDNTKSIIVDFFKNLAVEDKNPVGDLLYEGTLISKGISRTKIKIYERRGAAISKGRNTAIKNSSCDFICASDAGCILDKNWLEEIAGSLFSTGNNDAVGGFNLAAPGNFFQTCLASCIMQKKTKIKPNEYMPSSRNFGFKKTVWHTVGGYPEDMDYGEDMKFNFNIKAADFRIGYNPEAIVYWKMRKNLKAVFKQFFRYAKGDAIGKMYFYRHLIRFFSFIVFILIILVSILFSPWFLTSFIFLFFLYTYRSYSRIFFSIDNVLIKKSIHIKSLITIASVIFIPFLLIYIDIAKISGYIFGIFRKKKQVI